MTLHKIDIGTGRYLCDVIVGDDPPIEASALSPAYIVTPIPEGMTPERWNGTAWEYKAPEPPVEEVEITPDDMSARVLATEAALIELAAIIGGE